MKTQKDLQDQVQVLVQIARQCGVTTSVLYEWMREQLIPLHNDEWDNEAIETVRRIRRLTGLGVNSAGVEMILYMRQEMLRFQQEIMRVQQEQESLRVHYEQEINRLMREISGDF